MGKPVSRAKKKGASIRAVYKRNKTKRRTMDLDQIQERLSANKAVIIAGYQDIDKVGMGEFPCIECDRCFVDQLTLDKHIRGKPHKRRLKDLKFGAFTQKEADLAVGLTTENKKSTDNHMVE
eukprot:NODE_478_length_7890_cov_0.158388.p5 type:complete len:122 gc:universal NODE_478_length_7890_cov_0.158388:5676-6041(+)